MTLFTWSKTASSNATADATINWAEGQSPSSVNDSARASMAAVAKFRDDNSGSITTGGTSTAYTAASNQVFDTLAHLDQQQITIVPHTTSGASPTLNVDSLGAKPIRASTGVSVATGALVQGTPYRLTYYNTAGEFILEGGVAAIPGNWSIGGTLTVGAFANPATLRNSSYLNIDELTTHGDSAYTILATDRVVATSAAFTASRTWTLPAANAVNPGQSLTITDEANGITSTNSFVVSRAGSDTIVAQGTTVSSITLASAGALITLISDGSSKWIVQSLRQAPQVSVFTSGTSQAYTTPVGALYLKLRMIGSGGGGAGGTANNGSAGTDTSFGSWTAIHGSGGVQGGAGGVGGSGGANGTGTVISRVSGGSGGASNAPNTSSATGGTGAASPFGGAGGGGFAAAGQAATANSGSGGGGGASGSSNPGSGGGAGEYLEALITPPAATYTYTVGSGGNGGAAGGQPGGNGAAGRIEVTAYFQ